MFRSRFVLIILVVLLAFSIAPVGAQYVGIPVADICYNGDAQFYANGAYIPNTATFDMTVTLHGLFEEHVMYIPQIGPEQWGEKAFEPMVDLGFFQPGESKHYTVALSANSAGFHFYVWHSERWTYRITWVLGWLITDYCPGVEPPPEGPEQTVREQVEIVPVFPPMPFYGLAQFKTDTLLYWCPADYCGTGASVLEGQTAWLAEGEPVDGFWPIWWSNLLLYVPVCAVEIAE